MPTLNDLFTHHPPKDDQPDRYQTLREEAYRLALVIESSCPNSREKSLAITHLQEAVMFANASIAINE